MKKNQGFAGLFIKESHQKYIAEAYFSSGLLNLLKDGAEAGWIRGVGSYAKGMKLKSSATADEASVKGDYYIMDSDIGSMGLSPFGKLASVVDDLRKSYGAKHNYRYSSIESLNFEEVVNFDANDVAQAIGTKKNFTSPYKGVKVFSKVSKSGENKYSVEFGIEMIK